MRKSKTRRRVAVKTAAIAAVGAGILFGGVPAIASISAAPRPVNYTCKVGENGQDVPYVFQMDLTGPLTAPTPNSTVVATWKIGQPPTPVTAPPNVPTNGRLAVDGEVSIAGAPLPTPSEQRSVSAIAPSTVTAGQTLSPPPVLVTLTPTATGVITLQPSWFAMYVDSGSATDPDLLDCTVASAGATAGALMITVQPSGTAPSTTPGTTPPATPTTTPPVTTPSPTVTVTKTKTSEPVSTRQIDETPAGAASTGGGGDAGPDARYIMLSGALMVAFAGIGGLVLRRRTATRN